MSNLLKSAADMKITIDNNIYSFDSAAGIDISIPMQFNKNQNPKFYDSSKPIKRYYTFDENEYSIDTGAGCNVPLIELNVHCMGTHTESANHISNNGATIDMIKNLSFIPSQLITIKPTSNTDENYHASLNNEDLFITKIQLESQIEDNNFLDAIIIRTMPNEEHKKVKNYNSTHHPFLTTEAIKFIRDAGIKHLLIDTPSIDKYDDGGKLGNHHIFFNNNNNDNFNYNTITELIFVPDNCNDGEYLLNIGLPNFNLDAAPSRPIIYRIKNEK